MDFARNQLKKFGWSDGQGLGKSSNGILNPLKPNLKFDTAGMGHDPAKQFVDHWWVKAYNAVSDNIQVNADADEISIKTLENDVEYTSRHYTFKEMKIKNPELEYGAFVKTATLTNSGKEVEVKNKIKVKTVEETVIKTLTDEELFAACGGRTAHKGARHGLRLSGKLARIQAQEEELVKLDKYDFAKKRVVAGENQSTDNHDLVFDNEGSYQENSILKKKKKKKSQKEEKVEDENSNCDGKKKKDKKKNRDIQNDDHIIEKSEINNIEECALVDVEEMKDEVLNGSKKKKESRKRKSERLEENINKCTLEENVNIGNTICKTKKEKKSRKTEDEVVENIQINTNEKPLKKEQQNCETIVSIEENGISNIESCTSVNVEEMLKESKKKKKSRKSERFEETINECPLEEKVNSTDTISKTKKKKKSRKTDDNVQKNSNGNLLEKEQQNIETIVSIEENDINNIGNSASINVEEIINNEEILNENNKKKKSRKRKIENLEESINECTLQENINIEDTICKTKKKKKKTVEEDLATENTKINNTDENPLDMEQHKSKICPSMLSNPKKKKSRKNKCD